MPWDPKQYEKFAAERYAPFEDLARLLRVQPGLRVIDLGCGTGELTARLAGMLPESDVLGIDSSAAMLERAAEFARPGLRFEQRAIEDVAGQWDLVFSHAALQWLADHASLVPRLLSCVAPGGQIAVQMPSNFSHPTHTFLDDIAEEEPFRESLAGMFQWSRSRPVLPIEEYAKLLFDAGFTDITVFEKVYPHILDDADGLVEWMRGTALVPFMERLPDELREPFVERYGALLRERFPERPVLFGFRRTLFAATKPN
jgi:trans-aconitate 2-methyltransferase